MLATKPVQCVAAYCLLATTTTTDTLLLCCVRAGSTARALLIPWGGAVASINYTTNSGIS